MRRFLLPAALVAIAAPAWPAPAVRSPYIGYVFPAGGRQGTTFRATAGGQYLNGAFGVRVSGTGVRVRILTYARPLSLKDLRELRPLLLRGRPPLRRPEGQPARSQQPAAPAPGGQTDPFRLADHPVVQALLQLTRQERMQVLQEYFGRAGKRQPNAQIAEVTSLEITIEPGAAPGIRELRLQTPAGLTNPVRFEVGALPEACENEPFGVITRPTPTLDTPVVINGQITPGDVDRFRFHARRGQHLVAQVHARSLIPYLADAVPGWFQAVLTLRDAGGREIAFADDYRFDPDPVLHCEIPRDGEYELEIRDALYRGREDFVYRAVLGELPFITRIFPLGGRAGDAVTASIAGWNLPGKRLELDTRAGAGHFRSTALACERGLSNTIWYAVGSLPEEFEAEPNDTERAAQPVTLPLTLNGIIARPGDVDRFRFSGRAGQDVVAEVIARRIGSPLDSLLRLTDAQGRVIAWNDDYPDPACGLLTHHADSYLRTRLPKSGTYVVHVADAQQHGGLDYGYRLRLGPPQPGFLLQATPSSLSIPPTGSVLVTVHAVRQDGFDGEIQVTVKDAPPGSRPSGARIPPGRDRVRLTLAVPRLLRGDPFPLRLEGTARVGATVLTQPVMPADDRMQAFAYHHLVPAQELLIAPARGGRRMVPIELVGPTPVRLPAGGSARVEMRAGWPVAPPGIRLELDEPPPGITLADVTLGPGRLAFTLKADAGAPRPGYADNLIVQAIMESVPPQQAAGGRPRRPSHIPLGPLPAIPFEVVAGHPVAVR